MMQAVHSPASMYKLRSLQAVPLLSSRIVVKGRFLVHLTDWEKCR